MAAIVGFKAQASKRHHESDDESVENESSMSSDEEIEETPEEKRLRLATIYLEEIQRKGTYCMIFASGVNLFRYLRI